MMGNCRIILTNFGVPYSHTEPSTHFTVHMHAFSWCGGSCCNRDWTVWQCFEGSGPRMNDKMGSPVFQVSTPLVRIIHWPPNFRVGGEARTLIWHRLVISSNPPPAYWVLLSLFQFTTPKEKALEALSDYCNFSFYSLFLVFYSNASVLWKIGHARVRFFTTMEQFTSFLRQLVGVSCEW